MYAMTHSPWELYRKEIEAMSFEQFLINFKTEKMSSKKVEEFVLGARILKPQLQALMFCAFILEVPDKEIQKFYPEILIKHFKGEFGGMLHRGAKKKREDKKAKFTVVKK